MNSREENRVPGTNSSVIADDEKGYGITDREEVLLHLVLSTLILLLQPPLRAKCIGILSKH